MAQRVKSGKLKGNALLRAVYAELTLSLGELFAPREILVAAQKLIDISKDEYSDSSYQQEVHFSGYYTRDVDFMITHRPWTLAEYEDNCFEFDEEAKFTRDHAERRLKGYHDPDRYYHRG